MRGRQPQPTTEMHFQAASIKFYGQPVSLRRILRAARVIHVHPGGSDGPKAFHGEGGHPHGTLKPEHIPFPAGVRSSRQAHLLRCTGVGVLVAISPSASGMRVPSLPLLRDSALPSDGSNTPSAVSASSGFCIATFSSQICEPPLPNRLQRMHRDLRLP